MAKIIVLALDSGGPGVFPNRSSVKYEANEIFNKIQDGACDVDNDDEPEPAPATSADQNDTSYQEKASKPRRLTSAKVKTMIN